MINNKKIDDKLNEDLNDVNFEELHQRLAHTSALKICKSIEASVLVTQNKKITQKECETCAVSHSARESFKGTMKKKE